jgi:hypothetical protein
MARGYQGSGSPFSGGSPFRGFQEKLARMMQGRYGADSLNRFLLGVAIVCIVLSLFPPLRFISYATTVLLIICIARMYSRNYTARSRENLAFLRITTAPRQFIKITRLRIRHRTTKRYKKCPFCKTYFSLPKGKGKVSATCPSCHKKHTYRT